MSCYEWESGDIKIPAAEWAKFKTTIRAAYNAEQDKTFRLAETMRDRLLTAAKGQRDVNWSKVFDDLSYQQQAFRDHSSEAVHQAFNAILPYERRKLTGTAGAPLTPKKKDFAHANSSTKYLDAHGASLTFDDKTTTVHYEVGENNRACEHARQLPVIQAFFQALRVVKWTARSGGMIVGNDEYNRESRGDGGGANYVKDRFGADAVRQEKAMEKMLGKARPYANLTASRRWL